MIKRYTKYKLPEKPFIPGKENLKEFNFEISWKDTELKEVNWTESDEYLFGIDLFNHGFWFEAHEIWEAVWLAQNKDSETRVFMQGLIQLSAALFKKKSGKYESAERLAAKGIYKLNKLVGIKFGIDISELSNTTIEFIHGHSLFKPLIILNYDCLNSRFKD